jgi:hypothetical protein
VPTATCDLETYVTEEEMRTPTRRGIRTAPACFLEEVARLAGKRGTLVILDPGHIANAWAAHCRNCRTCGDGSLARVITFTGICRPSARGTNRKSGRRIDCSAAGTREMPAPEATTGKSECHSAGRIDLGSKPAASQPEENGLFCRMASESSVTIQVSCAS